MLRVSSIIAAGLAAAAIACASHPPSTEVTASDFDLNPLVGEWRGVSSSTQTGRTGTIAFTLRAGESSASGNIVLIRSKLACTKAVTTRSDSSARPGAIGIMTRTNEVSLR